MKVYVECPECCYAVSGDSMRAVSKVEDHMDQEHPESSKHPIETEVEES